MSYTLQHTAEAIDYKLNLIEKNKNLLPYPYTATQRLPMGLRDVGDGSLLTYGTAAEADSALLTTECSLPAGKYTVSLDIIRAFSGLSTSAGFSLKVGINDEEIDVASSYVFELATATNVSVSLNIPATFETDLLIRPQIEEGESKTDWVPYMKTIGSYVDERFNSTNAKIRVLAESLGELADNSLNGSGMPTVDQDGNALDSAKKYIALFTDGQWVATEISIYNGEVV